MRSSSSRTPPSALPATPAAAAEPERVAERDALLLRVHRDAVDRRVTHTALRRVDDAAPAHFVVGVHQRAQVREHVLHFTTVVELQPADDAVRDAGAHQRFLDHAALRVRAVEDRDVAEPLTVGLGEARGLVRDERRLVVLVFGVVAGDELTADLLRPQLLRVARRVVGDHRVGGVEDVLARPVVLLEDDHRRVREHLLEPHQVPVVRPAELVDRVVSDDAFATKLCVRSMSRSYTGASSGTVSTAVTTSKRRPRHHHHPDRTSAQTWRTGAVPELARVRATI